MAKILKELDELVENNIIDNLIKQKILDYYDIQKNKPYSALQLTFSLIGSVLIGLGVLLLIAYNWHGFSLNIKLALAVAPLILSYGGLAFCLWRYPQKEALLQSLALLSFLSTGGAMALLGQIYQIQSELHIFLRNWILLTLPLLLILPRFIMALFMGISIAYYFGLSRIKDGEAIFIILFGLVILGYYLYALYNRYSLREVLALNILIPIFSLFGILPFMDYFLGDFSLFFMFIWLFTLWVCLSHIYQIIYNPNGAINMLMIFAQWGCLIMLYIMSYKAMWKSMDGDMANIMQGLIAALWLVLSFKLVQKRSEIIFKNIHLLLLLTLLLPFIPYPLNIIATHIILIGFGLYYLIRGLSEECISLANLGLFMLCLLIALRFFEVDISFMTKGLIFIVIGILFIIGNIFMGKKIKKQEERA